MNLKLYHPFLSILFLCVFWACESQRWEMDAQEAAEHLSIQRFENRLYEISDQGVEAVELRQLANEFPLLYPLYVEAVMRFGQVGSEQVLQAMNSFMENPDIRELFATVAQQYPDLSEQEEQLSAAFQRYRYFLKRDNIPVIRSFISVFSFSVVADDSLLVLGLDNYLGASYPHYDGVGIPKYKSKTFTEDYMVSDAIKAWLLTEYELKDGANLIEQMIYYGKILYATQVLLPETKAAYILNYSEENIQWCLENEAPMWKHLIEQEALYSMENLEIRKYMGEAPFVPGFPEGSPGRAGQWIGWQIVKKFMDKNPELQLDELMEQVDEQKVLKESKYKP